MKKDPLILNIESATGTCSVAVSKGESIVNFQETDQAFEHSKVLTSLINKCLIASELSLNDMDAVAVSSGPGSYTSLRVGVSTAKGICYALNKPMISVDTLQALALSCMRRVQVEEAYYCPMIDARRMEVYCNVFDEKNCPISGPTAMVVGADSFMEYFEAGKTVIFCGNGAEKCKEELSSPLAMFSPFECSASYLPPLSSDRFEKAEFVDVAYFTPLYLKPPNITIPKNFSPLKT